MRRVSLFLFVFFACAAPLVPKAAFATLLGTEWNFTGGDYTPTYGTSTMSNWGDGTAAKVFFDTQTNFTSWPLLPGSTGDRVIFGNNSFNGGTQGVAISTGDANGGGTMVNQWSLVMDVMTVGNSASGYRSMADFSPTDSKDTGLYRAPDGTIGWASMGGNMAVASWYRVARVVDAAASVSKTYLNGALVATDSGAPGYTDLDNANFTALTANSHFLLFADNDTECSTWWFANCYYVERAMSDAEILGLGGPNAAGIMQTPEPSVLVLMTMSVIGLLAYAWRRRK
jgi:hypothetical protein